VFDGVYIFIYHQTMNVDHLIIKIFVYQIQKLTFYRVRSLFLSS